MLTRLQGWAQAWANVENTRFSEQVDFSLVGCFRGRAKPTSPQGRVGVDGQLLPDAAAGPSLQPEAAARQATAGSGAHTPVLRGCRARKVLSFLGTEQQKELRQSGEFLSSEAIPSA